VLFPLEAGQSGTRADVRSANAAATFDEVDGLRRLAARIARSTRRLVILVVGLAIVVLGLVLVPAPGPGWAVVFGGLALLSTEFAWAARLLNWTKRKVGRANAWIAFKLKPITVPLLRWLPWRRNRPDPAALLTVHDDREFTQDADRKAG
jgi:uncharacterized protein (TIGR02611 family)